jgi:hypothetical protein
VRSPLVPTIGELFETNTLQAETAKQHLERCTQKPDGIAI